MVDRSFFFNHGPFTAGDIAAHTGASLKDATQADKSLTDVAPLDRATMEDVSFFDNPKYVDQFISSTAGLCFVRARYADKAPAGMITMLTEDPYRCYALTAQRFYPQPASIGMVSVHAHVDSSARIGGGVNIGAGAVIGAQVTIGNRCIIGANSVIADGVTIGEDCAIGATSTISHAIIGSRAIIHRGVHIGQDGFGFAMGRDNHVKMPQLGRVVIGDDVEIGAGTTVDRGTGPDTIIGDGTKIDNLVQIGHNVHIGRRVIIIAQCGISGSTRIGDGVIIGGQSGISGHLKIGSGVKIAAQSGVMTDIPAGSSYGGAPAVPVMEWHRQTIAVSRLTRSKRGSNE